ncbi:MAG: hypothetical protein QG645_47 [Patescibacteria group bacterium]|nr:hypothetical protein [Patescibacteria group bacterium]
MFWHSNNNLYDQNGFYDAFIKDVKHSNTRVIIESPFITTKRINQLSPILSRLIRRGVAVVINTKPVEEQNALLRNMAYEGIAKLQDIGVRVIVTAGHHRKLAIIDDDIIWEGSLNILSQNDSCEIMCRISSKQMAIQMLKFLNLDRFYTIK